MVLTLNVIKYHRCGKMMSLLKSSNQELKEWYVTRLPELFWSLLYSQSRDKKIDLFCVMEKVGNNHSIITNAFVSAIMETIPLSVGKKNTGKIIPIKIMFSP